MLERFEEGARGLDREPSCETEQVSIARDEHTSHALGQREQVIVIGVRRAFGGRRWVGGEDPVVCKYGDELSCFCLRRDARQQLQVGRARFSYGEQQRRDHKIELTGDPASDDLAGRSAARAGLL